MNAHTPTERNLSGTHSAGSLTVDANVARALGIRYLSDGLAEKTPSAQPLVSARVSSNIAKIPDRDVGAIVNWGTGYWVRAQRNIVSDAEVEVESDLLLSNPAELTSGLTKVLSERLHGNRMKWFGFAAGALVVGLFVLKDGLTTLKEAMPYGLALLSYIGVKGLARVIPPRFTGSVKKSEDYARRVVNGVAVAVNDARSS